MVSLSLCLMCSHPLFSVTDEATALKQNYNTEHPFGESLDSGWWTPPNSVFSQFQLHEPLSQVWACMNHWCHGILKVLVSSPFRIRTSRCRYHHYHPEHKSIVPKSRRLWLYPRQKPAWITTSGSRIVPRLH